MPTGGCGDGPVPSRCESSARRRSSRVSKSAALKTYSSGRAADLEGTAPWGPAAAASGHASMSADHHRHRGGQRQRHPRRPARDHRARAELAGTGRYHQLRRGRRLVSGCRGRLTVGRQRGARTRPGLLRARATSHDHGVLLLAGCSTRRPTSRDARPHRPECQVIETRSPTAGISLDDAPAEMEEVTRPRSRPPWADASAVTGDTVLARSAGRPMT